MVQQVARVDICSAKKDCVMSDLQTAKDIFLQALELASDEARARLLDEVCRDNVELRRRVEALLAAHDDPDSYLERPAARFDVTATTDGSGREERRPTWPQSNYFVVNRACKAISIH